MPEGISIGGTVIDRPEATKWSRENVPPPDAKAPRGYTWSRQEKKPVPKRNGPILYKEDVEEEATPHPDPEPAWAKEPKQKLTASKTVKDDMAGLAGLIGTPLLALLTSIDPYCASAFATNFEPIVDATIPLMCRSEKVVKFFSEDKSDWMMWGKLALVLAPVGRAIAEHHIFKTVETVRNPDGTVTVNRKAPQNGHPDHLQPPVMEEFVPEEYVA